MNREIESQLIVSPDAKMRARHLVRAYWPLGAVSLCLVGLVAWAPSNVPRYVPETSVETTRSSPHAALGWNVLHPTGGVLPSTVAARGCLPPQPGCARHRVNLSVALSRVDGMVLWPEKPISLVADVLLPLRPEFGYCIGPKNSDTVVCLGAGAEAAIPLIERLAVKAGLSVTRRPLGAHSRLLLPFDHDIIIEARDRALYYCTVGSPERAEEMTIRRQPLGPATRFVRPMASEFATGVLPSQVTIGVVGDIMPAGGVGQLSIGNVTSVLESASSILCSVDISLANLEAPLTTSRQATPLKTQAELRSRQEFVFKAAPHHASALLQSLGINAVSLANNHTVDYQARGIDDTISHLQAAGIAYTGAGTISEARRPAQITSAALKCGLLSYVGAETLPRPSTFEARPDKPGVALVRYGPQGPDEATRAMLSADIKKLRREVDLVIISLHWGDEGTSSLRPGQRELAHFCIDEGADFVWGHHPHRLQRIEIYRGKLIAYSMGNFVFNSPPRRHLFRTGILITCFDTRGLTAASLIAGAVGSHGNPFGSETPGLPRMLLGHDALASEIRADLGFSTP